MFGEHGSSRSNHAWLSERTEEGFRGALREFIESLKYQVCISIVVLVDVTLALTATFQVSRYGKPVNFGC